MPDKTTGASTLLPSIRFVSAQSVVKDDFAIVGPPVGRATRPTAGPTAGNPGYSLETKGRWYELRPFNLPNPESAGKISYRSSLLPVVT